MIPIHYRAPTPDDLPFIIDSWLRANRYSEFAAHIPHNQYYEFHRPIVENLLHRSMVSVLSDPEDTSHIYGYVVYEFINKKFCLHYIYLKSIYRRFGVVDQTLKILHPQIGQEESYATHMDKTKLNINKKYMEIKHSSWFIKNKTKYKLLYTPYLIA